MPSLSRRRLRGGPATTMFPVMSPNGASAPTPTLPRDPRVKPGEGRESGAPLAKARGLDPRGAVGWGALAPGWPNLADRVLYRDGLVLVVDKPAGIPVHAGPSGGANLEHWFPLLRFGLPRPPALAHRLDRDTSGVLVLGRHPKALRRHGRLFGEARAGNAAGPVVTGRMQDSEGVIAVALTHQ